MGRIMVTVRLDKHILDVLHDIRERDGVLVNEQIRRAVTAWLEHKGEIPPAPPRSQRKSGVGRK